MSAELLEACRLLRRHNEWRRYNGPLEDEPDMQGPAEVGRAIDVVCDYVQQALTDDLNRKRAVILGALANPSAS